MASTPSPLLNIELQAAGENLNTWGQPKLNNALERLSEATAATTGVSTYPITLTSTNYVANQARNMILSCTGAGGTITIPGQSKLYIVRNASSGDVTLTTGGGTTAVVAAGDSMPVICDGTDVRMVQATDFQGQRIKDIATPVSATDASNKSYSDSLLVAANAYTDATAFAAGSLPGQGGNAGKFLYTNGTVTTWQLALPAFTGTANYTLLSSGTAAYWGSPAVARGALGLGGAAVLNVGTTAGTVAAGDDTRLADAMPKTGGVFSGAIAGSIANFTSFTGTLSGNATTANSWFAARTLLASGDAFGSVAFDGSANFVLPLTLSNTAVTPGAYTAANITVDAKGRVTAAASGASTGFARLLYNSGASSITASTNIASVTPVGGAGDFDVVFTSAAANANYIVTITAEAAFTGVSYSPMVETGSRTVNGFSINILDQTGIKVNPSFFHLMVST